MANYLGTIKKEYKLNLKTLYDDYNSAKDKDLFRPNGTQIYAGKQGSGKTISAIYHVYLLKKRYPKSILVTNLNVTTMNPKPYPSDDFNPETDYYSFQSVDELQEVLVKINNDKFGVIYLIDEIHTYFNSLESKNVPMFVFTEISQQRKQRKLIIGTSQLFMRTGKPLREQADNVIVCKTLFGVLTLQTAYEGETLEQDYSGKLIGNKKKSGFFIQTRETRQAFDTFQKVVSGQDQYEQLQKPLEIKQTGLMKKTFTLK